MLGERLVLIEKKANFLITGKNSHGNFTVKPTSFMQLTRCPDTAIIVGTIQEGIVENGNAISMVFPKGDPIAEVAVNLQIQKKDVPSAETYQSIGIKLSRETYQTLLTRNNTSN